MVFLIVGMRGFAQEEAEHKVTMAYDHPCVEILLGESVSLGLQSNQRR